jgi:hypothetical protein
MRRGGIVVLAAAAGFGFGVSTPVGAGPCSSEIAQLEKELHPPDARAGANPGSRARAGQSKLPPLPYPLPPSRYDPLLEEAKKLDAENNPDCRKPLTEIRMLINM